MMAYQDGYVVSIISNGHPVRETKGSDGKRTCVIPFDSEYKIRIKNPVHTHALVSVFIDGTPVTTGGKTFVVAPYSNLDIERFVTNSSEHGKKFKFVSLNNPDVQDPTSNENGIVRVEIQPAYINMAVCGYAICGSTMHTTAEALFTGLTYTSDNLCRSTTLTSNEGTPATALNTDRIQVNCCASAGKQVGLTGATIEGGVSEQEFLESNDKFFSIGCKSVIEMRLVGPADAGPDWRIIGDRVFFKNTMVVGVKSMSYSTEHGLTLNVDKSCVRLG